MLLPIGAIFFLTANAQAEKQLDYPINSTEIELKIHAKKMPRFPIILKQKGYTKGEVELIVEIDEFGELRDHIVSKTTRNEFAEEVKKVIHAWNFDPPKWRNKTVPVITPIRVFFESTGDVVSFDLSSGLMNIIFHKDRVTKTLVSVDDLDEFPTPKIVTSPRIPTKLFNENKGTHGVFTFYIDQLGRVRMPALEKTNGQVDVRVLVAAQDALMEWKFNPPTARGRPVIVQVSQRFQFGAN